MLKLNQTLLTHKVLIFFRFSLKIVMSLLKDTMYLYKNNFMFKQVLFGCIAFFLVKYASARELVNANGYIIYKTFDIQESQRLAGLNGNGILKQFLPLQASESYSLKSAKADALGMTHERYQQYFGQIPVEFGVYTLHYYDGRVKSATGEYFAVDEQSPRIPVISTSMALEYAKKHIGASKYMWEDEEMELFIQTETGNTSASYYPQANLVYIKDFIGGKQTARLAYKFDIYAQEPVSRGDVYVDAETGKVLFVNKKICHADQEGTAETRYNGTRTITTFNNGTLYQLKETANRKCQTYNLKGGSNYNAAKLFTDVDNNWTATEYDNAKKDNAALDAHFGAEATWDYWFGIHNRNSFDGNGGVIKSYVHYGVDYDNAFWDGERMTYGDGSGTFFDALTSLDVCAHEIGHGVCTHTANLIYGGESGAMNEGYSDIWAACVENFSGGRTQDQIWQIGEDIERREGHIALRVMSNPKLEGNPDTYLGEFWYDEVHNTSGIFNYWFYLLSEGGSGVNDNNNSYNVNGISIAKAEQIAFRAESVYMTPSTNFVQAREITLQCAEDLFGANSPERKSVDDAWYAVGIGEPCAIETTNWNFKILSVGNNSITFTIDNNSTSIDGKYLLEYIQTDSLYDGTPSLVTLISGDTFRIVGLEKCTRYTVSLNLLCESGILIETNLDFSFRTKGCNCTPISGLRVSYVNYFDATIVFDNYEPADSFELAYRVLGSNDWNYIHVENFFFPYGEYINIYQLIPGATYEAKVSVFCNNSWQPYSGTVQFTTYEAECNAMSDLTLYGGTQTTQGFFGTSSNGNVAQKIMYRTVYETETMQRLFDYNTSYISLYNLVPSTNYLAYIESQCYDSTWNISDTLYFRTKDMICSSYNTISIEGDIKPTEVSLWWWGVQASNVTEYQFEYTDYSTGNSVKVSLGLDTSYLLTNLKPNTTYSVRVRAKCGGSWRVWSNSIFFNTPIASGNNYFANEKIILSISPNPTNNRISIVSQQQMLNQVFSIIDITGKMMLERTLNLEKNVPVTLELNQLSTGTYFLYTNVNGVHVNQKVILIE